MQKIHAGTLGFWLLLMGALPAPLWAQESANNRVEEVLVTGSRIKSPNLTLSSPVASVDAETMLFRQVNVVEEFLREIPGTVPSIGAQANNGNDGSTFINLRGLGSNRNITLLNGVRVVPAGLQGRTNLDMIPVALLERTDVLTGGAGSTYGADAIAGVVNFITRRDFEGLDLRLSNGETFENDGRTLRLDLTIGGNFSDGRGNAVIGLGYTDREAVLQGDRHYGFAQIDSASGNPGGSSFTVPTRITAVGPALPKVQSVVPSATSRSLQIAQDGESFVPFYQRFNFNPLNLYQLPLEQYRAFGQVSYEIQDGIDWYAELLYVQSTNETNLAPSATFGQTLQTPLSNPFLTAGMRNQLCSLFDINATDCAAAGAADPFRKDENGQFILDDEMQMVEDPNYREIPIAYGRRFVEMGPRTNSRQSTLWQFKTGAKVRLTETFDLEVLYAIGKSDLRAMQNGNGTATRLQQGVRTMTDSQGNTVCQDPSNDCAPINLFGAAIGSITPEAVAFLDTGNGGSQFTELEQAQAFITGDLPFALLPTTDRPVSLVVGAEYRQYVAGFSSDLLTKTPGEVLGNGAANPDLTGTYDVTEAFTEFNVPILQDTPYAEELTLQLGARLSDYSTAGDELTWKVGVTYTPITDVQFRGNYQAVTRAPNINELFLPPVTGLGNFDSDPCVGAAPTNNAELRAICIAQGASAGDIGGIELDAAGQVAQTISGNLNLGAEDADTLTLGFIVQPEALPGLAVTLDYYNIKVTDAITFPTTDDVLSACFGANYKTSLSISAASASDPACTGIRRNPTNGNLWGNLAITKGLPKPYTNAGELETDGFDLSVSYAFDLAELAGRVGLTDIMGANLGQIDYQLNANYTLSSVFQATPTSVSRDCVGYYSVNCASLQPELMVNQRTTYRTRVLDRPLDVSLLYRYIDTMVLEPSVRTTTNAAGVTSNAFQSGFMKINAEHYFDLTVRAGILEQFDITLAVLNITDNEPKLVGNTIGNTTFNSGNVYPATYDPLGRRYAVTLRYRMQ